VSLQHELRDTSVRVPELDTTVFGTTQYPVTMWGKRNTEHKVFVTLKSADALAARLVPAWDKAVVGRQLPHLDCLVQTATDKTVSRRSESHTIDAVLVAVLAFEAYDKLSSLDVPDADALVERSGCNVEVVWRDRHSGDTVLNGEIGDLHVGLEIPKTDTPITTTRCNDLAVPGKVQRVDVLLVSSELVLNGAASDIPNLARR
jgi:hypothetical protein